MSDSNYAAYDALDRALVQCLRIFAQHGRRLRTQETDIKGGGPIAKKSISAKENDDEVQPDLERIDLATGFDR